MTDEKKLKIYVTGTPGAGKTTTIAFLTKQLQASGFDVEFVDHPGDNAAQLENLLLDPDWLERNMKEVVTQLKGKLIISEGAPLKSVPTCEQSPASQVFNDFLTEELPPGANGTTVVAGKLRVEVPSFMDVGVDEIVLYPDYSVEEAEAFIAGAQLQEKNRNVSLVHGLIWLTDGSYLQYHRTSAPYWHRVGPTPPIPVKP